MTEYFTNSRLLSLLEYIDPIFQNQKEREYLPEFIVARGVKSNLINPNTQFSQVDIRITKCQIN